MYLQEKTSEIVKDSFCTEHVLVTASAFCNVAIPIEFQQIGISELAFYRWFQENLHLFFSKGLYVKNDFKYVTYFCFNLLHQTDRTAGKIRNVTCNNWKV